MRPYTAGQRHGLATIHRESSPTVPGDKSRVVGNADIGQKRSSGRSIHDLAKADF